MNNSAKVVQAAGKKLVTPWLGVEIGTSNIDPTGERPHTGLGNLEIGPKYQFLKNAEHEVIMSIGFEAEIGGTGTPHSVANSFSTWTPTLVASSIGGEALTLGLITTVFTKTHFWQSLEPAFGSDSSALRIARLSAAPKNVPIPAWFISGAALVSLLFPDTRVLRSIRQRMLRWMQCTCSPPPFWPRKPRAPIEASPVRLGS